MSDLQRVRAARDRYRAALAALELSREELAREIVRAVEAGVQQLEIARELGVSKQRVHDIVKAHRSPDGGAEHRSADGAQEAPSDRRRGGHHGERPTP